MSLITWVNTFSWKSRKREIGKPQTWHVKWRARYTCVTAADFSLQLSRCTTSLLTPALLLIGRGKHKILIRSMRFLHTPPTGNLSRAQRREDMKEKQEEKDLFFCWDLQKEARKEHSGTAQTWNNVCSGFCSDIVDGNASIPLSYLCNSKKSLTRLEVKAAPGDTLHSYLHMH